MSAEVELRMLEGSELFGVMCQVGR